MQLGKESGRPRLYGLNSGHSQRPWLRYRWLLLAAFVATALTFFSLFRVGLAGGPFVSFRHQPTWQSIQTLRVALGASSARAMPGKVELSSDDQAASLAHLYAMLANSDAVHARVLKQGPLKGEYQAIAGKRAAATASSGPFVTIVGRANSRARATQTTARVSQALRTYLSLAQKAAQIPRSSRVGLELASTSRDVTLVHGRGLARPLLVFGALMVLLGLAAFSTSKAVHP